MSTDVIDTYTTKIREMITSSPECVRMMADVIFPMVSGCYDAKLGAMCMLASPRDCGSVRARLHVLYHGLPGTGKSQLSETITSDFGGLKLTCDPKSSALKGDGRRSDGGVKLLNLYSGHPVVIHDIELTKEIDTIRDVMESGSYTLTSGGQHVEYEAQCSILGSSNDITKISDAILSRFDLIYQFDTPSAAQSMDIVDDVLNEKDDFDVGIEFKRLYISMVQDHTPKYVEKDAIRELYKEFFDKHGGKTGRYIWGVDRVAKSLSKLHFSDVTPEHVEEALKMKLNTEAIISRQK